MSMTAALSHVFSPGGSLFSLDRQRARFASQRIHSHHTTVVDDDHDDDDVITDLSSEQVHTSTSTTSNNNNNNNNNNNSQTGSNRGRTTITRGLSTNVSGGMAVAATENNRNNNDNYLVLVEEGAVSGNATDDDDDDDDDVEAAATTTSTTATTATATAQARSEITRAGATMTLAELEEERELARRRSSACVLLGVFVLFRLWVEAIQDADFGLLLLCLVGTSWTARWIRYNREREEELDRRIAHYLANASATASGEGQMDRHDLRLLSFQAQLALAIMESQRQMMQGGYGHPDDTNASPGVSEAARAQWNRFAYHAMPEDAVDNNTGSGVGRRKSKIGYGSVAQDDAVAIAQAPPPHKEGYEDGPHCSICLAEYEDNDQLVQLPCLHVYHEECIASWTENHVKCPLCNFDLETTPQAAAAAAGAAASTTSPQVADAVV